MIVSGIWISIFWKLNFKKATSMLVTYVDDEFKMLVTDF